MTTGAGCGSIQTVGDVGVHGGGIGEAARAVSAGDTATLTMGGGLAPRPPTGAAAIQATPRNQKTMHEKELMELEAGPEKVPGQSRRVVPPLSPEEVG